MSTRALPHPAFDLTNTRVLPSLERDSWLVAKCKQPVGQLILLAVFTLLLSLFTTEYLPIAVFLALTIAFPGHRRAVVSLAGIVMAVAVPNWLDISFLQRIAAQEGLSHLPLITIRLVVASVFLLLSALAALAFRFPRRFPARRPIFTSILCFCAFAVLVSSTPLFGRTRIAAWIGVLAVAHMLWFFCYTLTDRDSRGRDSLPLQTGLWRPVWMLSTNSATPFAKGAAYLRKIEARNAEELAVTQLKGLKLLMWATILRTAQFAYEYLIYLRLSVPKFEVAFSHSVEGHPFRWYVNGLSLVAAFFLSLLQMSVWGHQIIACVRMAGFRALRNTYKPMESRTLAEFWNRFYFYFKELLVDMFFYPTYFRYFKKHPRLRMAAATMMAACVGNALFHFLRDISCVAELGWRGALVGFQTYLFYCFVLGAGISISQMRDRRGKDRTQTWVRRRVVPIICVSGFYCLLHVFDDPSRAYSLRDHFIFVGRLLGL